MAITWLVLAWKDFIMRPWMSMTFTMAWFDDKPEALLFFINNLNAFAVGFGYKLTSNELLFVVVIGKLIFVPNAQPVCVSVCERAALNVPQRL